ncbi:MAG: hypothetical protein ACRC46_11555 [Thermoguttaceae bacterium]
MLRLSQVRYGFCVSLVSLVLTGCPCGSSCSVDSGSVDSGSPAQPAGTTPAVAKPAAQPNETATPICKLLDEFGRENAAYTLSPDGSLLTIDVRDGSQLTAEAISLIANQKELTSLKIRSFRDMNHDMVLELKDLKKLTTLGISGSVIKDETVAFIVETFPELVELELSSNSNLTNASLREVAKLGSLERFIAIQNRFSDLGGRNVGKLKKLQVLDLRGNVEVGTLTMEAIATLPELRVLKHRGAVGDDGVAALASAPKLESLLVQDFIITSNSGESFRKMPALNQLEVFRCTQFTTPGVLALAGMPLKRLQLRDIAAIDDEAMQVFRDLPQMERLFLHELPSVSDAGLANLAALQSLKQIDIWAVPGCGDATVAVLAQLPNLEDISIRGCGITDAAIDSILSMKNLKKVALVDNVKVTPAALERLPKTGAK